MSKPAYIGWMRHPETHEYYFPWTHYSAVIGLDAHVVELIGGSVYSYIPLAGSSAITGNLISSNTSNLGSSVHPWGSLYTNNLYLNGSQFSSHSASATINGTAISSDFLGSANFALGSIYAPTAAGTSGQFLKSTAGVPTWENFSNVGLSDLNNDWSTLGTISFNGNTFANIMLSSAWANNIAFYAPDAAGTSSNKYLYWDTSTSKITWCDLATFLGGTASQIMLGNGSTLTKATTTVTLNNTSSYTSLSDTGSAQSFSIYAPTVGGKTYNLLMGQGLASAPTWTDLTLTSDGLLKFTAGSGWSIDTNTYLTSVAFDDLTSTPTTISGYGITDASISSHSVTLGSNSLYVPYYSNEVFYFDDNHSFSLTSDITSYLTSAANGTSDITTTSSNDPYIRILKLQAGDSSYDNAGTFHFSGVVNLGVGISVVGSANKSISIGLAGPTGTSGYLKKNADDTWSLDAYGGATSSMVNSAGNATTSTTTASAGLKTTTSSGTTYQKISTAALEDDVSEELILNGNFN